MEEDKNVSKFKLERSIRQPAEFPEILETSYKVTTRRHNQRKFPYITFADNHHSKLQVCDMERYFYIIPTTNTGTNKVSVKAFIPKSEFAEVSQGSKYRPPSPSESNEHCEALEFEEPFAPTQYFPNNIISKIQPKTSKLGRKLYLMICVDSPLFIHRKNDVIKMSIDFKDSPIANVFYDIFSEKDILSILILTHERTHNCLIDLRNLRIIKKVVKEGGRIPIISSFLSESVGHHLYGVDRDGRIYDHGKVVHDPKFEGDRVVSKVVKDNKNNMAIVIGYIKSEFYDPNKPLKPSAKKGQYRDAISLSLLRISNSNGKAKFSYPDQFIIDHPNFCRWIFSAANIKVDLMFASNFVDAGHESFLPAVSKTSKSLYLFQVQKKGKKHSLTIAHTIRIKGEFLKDVLMEVNDRKTKIWTLLNNVYVQWNSNVISVWKFKNALTPVQDGDSGEQSSEEEESAKGEIKKQARDGKASKNGASAKDSNKNSGNNQKQRRRTNNRKKVAQDENPEEEWVKKPAAETK